MESESYKTPNKIFSSPRFRLLHQGIAATPGSIQKKNRGKFHIIPVANSSPCNRFPKIVNPFEQHLADRLHLPVICSPSLFQRPTTPQHNSTQFEWTIDDVSSLAPANVEVSELQFQQYNDPELEEKAQAAINSYFKDNEIVPSPIDCPLRNQKIVLRNDSSLSIMNVSREFINNNNKKDKRFRDGICQTVFTFPPILPKEVEDILAPFCTYTQDQQQSATIDCDTTMNYEARDASLRRKLFEAVHDTSSDYDSLNDIDLKALSPAPRTPEIDKCKIQIKTRNFGTPTGNSHLNVLVEKSPNISISPVKKETFGSLSPISKLSPSTPSTKRSPVSFEEENKSPNSSLFRSTPEKLKKPERIAVVTSTEAEMKLRSTLLQQNLPCNMSIDDKENEWNYSYEEVSSSSQREKNCTPNRRTRISGKNLSLSFSMFANDNDLMEETTEPAFNTTKSSFYRTDSGFNEPSSSTTQTEDSIIVRHCQNMIYDENNLLLDVSMRSETH